MSGDAASLPCPLCLNSGFFNTVQSLRDRLISVSTTKMICPVCQEEVFGLDKLTIHLFSHVKLQNISNCEFKDQKSKNVKPSEVQINSTETNIKKKTTATVKNNRTPCTSNDPLQYVKIYPKLPTVSQSTIHHFDSSSQKIKEELCNSPHGSNLKTDKISNNFCSECGLQFVNMHILKMHKCLIHNIVEKTNEESKHHKCHICPKFFKMRGSLMVHLRVAHFGFKSTNSKAENEISDKIRDENQEQSQATTEIAVTIDKVDNKQWQCDVCRKNFTTKYFLKKHKRLHTGETPYACSQCNKTFTFQQSYHKHLLYHNDEKPHVCNYCGRAFKELSTLHNHQRIHTGEKPFSCETCGKCFRQRVSYLVHRRIHTGVMPYKCTACNKSFRYKVSQRTHKCLAQPPGMVIRQGGELLEKLKKKQSNLDDESPIYVEISEASAELVRTGAQLSLEDTVTENFTLIPESFERKNNNGKSTSPKDSQNDINQEFIIDKNVPSPSEIMKNLCLSNDENFSETSDNNLQKETNLENFDLFNDFNVFL